MSFKNSQMFSNSRPLTMFYTLCRCFRAAAYMKHDSRKHVVTVWKICKGENMVHSPLSLPIEMSKKHLGLLFSDIFHAKRKRKYSHCTRHTRTHEDVSYHVTRRRIPLIRPLIARQNGGCSIIAYRELLSSRT